MSGHPIPAPGPVRALQSALTAEHAAVYGYGVVGAYLTGSMQATATSDWVAHQVARDRLEALLRSFGAQPAAAIQSSSAPQPSSSMTIVLLKLTYEPALQCPVADHELSELNTVG